MKVEVVQTACPASTGNYDITGATPNNDMVGVLLMGAATTTNDNVINSVRFSLGITDLANNLCLGQGAQNATVGAGIRSEIDLTNCLMTPNGTGGQVAPVAAYGSTLANGVRLTTSAIQSGRLTNALLISGSDVENKAGNVLFGPADTSKVVSHGLAGTPDVLVFLVSIGSASSGADGTGFCIGFWDRTTGNQTSISYRATTGANPTDNAAYASDVSVAEILDVSTTLAHMTVGTIGASQFTLTLNSASGVNALVGWYALRGKAAQMFTKSFLTTLPTSTGINALVSGMVGRPQCVIVIPTRMTGKNAVKHDDTAGSFGVGVSASNDYVNTTDGATANSFQHNVASSVANHTITVSQGLWLDLTNGSPETQAVISSWDPTGASFNFTLVGASAFETMVLAFGMPSSSHGLALLGVGS